MAEDHGRCEDEFAYTAMLPVMYVGAADAGVFYCYQGVVWADLGDWLLGVGY